MAIFCLTKVLLAPASPHNGLLPSQERRDLNWLIVPGYDPALVLIDPCLRKSDKLTSSC